MTESRTQNGLSVEPHGGYHVDLISKTWAKWLCCQSSAARNIARGYTPIPYTAEAIWGKGEITDTSHRFRKRPINLTILLLWFHQRDISVAFRVSSIQWKLDERAKRDQVERWDPISQQVREGPPCVLSRLLLIVQETRHPVLLPITQSSTEHCCSGAPPRAHPLGSTDPGGERVQTLWPDLVSFLHYLSLSKLQLMPGPTKG